MPPKPGYGRYPVGMHFVTSTEQRDAIEKHAADLGISIGAAIRELVQHSLNVRKAAPLLGAEPR